MFQLRKSIADAWYITRIEYENFELFEEIQDSFKKEDLFAG